MTTIQPVIAIERIMDTVWTLAFVPESSNTARIVALSPIFKGSWREEQQLPTYRLEEGEHRIVNAITITQNEDGKEVETHYSVTNPQFIFSYSEVIPDEVKPLKHFTFKVTEGLASVTGTCSTWARATVNNIAEDCKVKKALAELGIQNLKLSFDSVSTDACIPVECKPQEDNDLKTRCLIEASGAFLTELLTVELLEASDDEIMAFIEDHKWQPVEDYEAEEIWNMMDDHALIIQRFVQSELELAKPKLIQRWLEQNVSLEDLDVIENALVSDIWYDAQQHDDQTAAEIIEDTQNAMDTVTKTLREAILDEDSTPCKPLYAVIWHYEGESPTLFTCRASDSDDAEAMLYAELIDHESNSGEFHIDSVQAIEL